MAPSRKSRSVNKRFSSINDTTSNKNVENNTKRRQRKRKLSDMLGPQWSKEELERFYRAYRKHGTDWEKVATIVRDRSVEMVEALYTLNRAYLNLPKGYASAAGLIAMMTDHYTNLEESDSEQETNVPVVTPRKPQKRTRGTTKDVDASAVPDLLQSQPAASNYGCLTLLKKRRSDSRPWAVGKRTPRVPVSFSYEKDSEEKYISPIRQNQKLKDNQLEDDVAHEIALVLTEASQKVGSPQVSQTPNRNTETPSPIQNEEHMHAESETTSSKLRGSEMDEGGCELSLGSTEADMGHYTREKRFREGKRDLGSGRKPDLEENLDNPLDDVKEACSGTEEGKNIGATRGKFETGIVGTRLARLSNKGPRKRSKKVLFGEGEADAVDALQTLADMSLMLPEAPVDTESSVHVEEQKMGIVVKSKSKRNRSTAGVKVASPKKTKGKVSPHDVSPVPKGKDVVNQSNSEIWKRGKKVLPSESSEIKECVESRLGDSQKVKASDNVVDLINRGNYSHDTAHQKQGKVMKNPEFVSSADQGRESNDSAPSSVQVLSSKQFNLPTKLRSRRKVNASKPLVDKNIQYSEDVVNGQHDIAISSFKDHVLGLKKKLSNCLSWYQLRRWCVFEWFYSAIDYPWFAKREFVEYLDHVGLGHVPRLTRVEWGVIRSSLGKPRRFSEQFLKEEKEKLNQYRESVRKHYTELRAGIRDGLPTDLARPLSVGQRIVAIHPKTRETHDGSVLTVEHNRCRIQFDQPELGVELVMDVDCMPSNPLENLPASFARQNVVLNKSIENLNALKINGQLSERKTEGYITFAPCENLENADGLLHSSPSTYHISNLLKHGTGGSTNSNMHVITESGETVINQQAINDQPFLLARIQGKDADIQALYELNRALDKKEAVVSELKRMNNEVENQKDGENSLKDSELFKKHYAAVLLQLNEVNEQVSAALCCLRQRNTYQGNDPHGLKPTTYIGEPVGPCSSLDGSADETHESGSHVIEIVESSRTKAQAMVDAAMLAMSSLKKEGSNIENMEEAIDFVNNHLATEELSTSAMRSSIPANPVPGTVAAQDQSSSSTTNLEANSRAPGTELDQMSNQNEAQVPSELITQCVATLLMIQKCTERQFPPSDVAQVLDSAVTSLKPCCSQNLPIYADIQKCIGIIRNQILALIPT